MLKGGCLCGAVRYTIEGEPLYAGLCHCRDCQRSSGSAFAPFIGVASQNFHVTGKTIGYTNVAESGKGTTRNFCPICGSTVFGSGDRDDVTVYAGTLDEPSAFRPRDQVFVRSRQAWANIPTGALPEHNKLPDGA